MLKWGVLGQKIPEVVDLLLADEAIALFSSP
jgi:hypothetical protein